MKKAIEELLETPYWIIDILPVQVPKDSAGQYFAIEDYYLNKGRSRDIKKKHIGLILKINCYRDLSFDDEDRINPAPEEIALAMEKRYLNIRVGGSLIVSKPDDTYLTLYDPDEELLELVKMIAAAEGLFVWKP